MVVITRVFEGAQITPPHDITGLMRGIEFRHNKNARTPDWEHRETCLRDVTEKAIAGSPQALAALGDELTVRSLHEASQTPYGQYKPDEFDKKILLLLLSAPGGVKNKQSLRIRTVLTNKPYIK